MTDRSSIEELHSQVTSAFPRLNVVINNAGLMQAIRFQGAEPAHVADEVAVNLTGPVLVTQVFLPHLLTQSHAAVLNVTSGIAYFPFDKAPLYSASKLGLHSYTQSLRTQLKGTSVRSSNLRHPGRRSRCSADPPPTMSRWIVFR